MYISGIDDYPELDLQEMMDRVFDNYPHEFRSYWALDGDAPPDGLEEEHWNRKRELDRLAKRIAELAAALVRPGKLKEPDLQAPVEMREAASEARAELKKIVEQIRAEYPDSKDIEGTLLALRTMEEVEYDFFRACLQLYLAEYLMWPGSMAERVIELTRFAARVREHRARQYLGRVSRCYVYGMTPELAVMARAAMAALLEEVIPEEQVREVRRIPKHMRVGLADYIQVARGTVLSDDAGDSAWKLKRYGDDAAHVSAEIVKDPNAILEELVVVLNALDARPRKEPR